MATKLKSMAGLFGFVSAARQAITSADHSAVLADIDASIEARTRDLAEMESRRGESVLAGTDPDDFHRRLVETREAIQTLRATRETAVLRRDEAAAREQRAALEQQAGTVRLTDLPTYESALRRFHDRLVKIAEDAALIEAHGQAISAMDDELKRQDRHDLVIGVERIRQQVIEELSAPADFPEFQPRPMPPLRKFDETGPRQGESPESFERRRREYIESHKRQHEASEALRRQNWQAQRDAAVRREDPLQIAGERAIAAIEATSFPMDEHEAARNRRRVRVESFVDRNTGQAVKKIQAVDGRGRPQADPRIEERRQAAHRAFVDGLDG